jgi:hypothetical protein
LELETGLDALHDQRGENVSKWIYLAAGLLVLFAAFAVLGGYPLLYDGRIYPGVSVQGLDVGGMTVEAAQDALRDGLPDPAMQGLVLRAAGHSWQLTWAKVGKAYDVAETAEAAYRVGREGPWYAPWRVRFQGRSLAPYVVEADAALVEQALAPIAEQVAVPPGDARVRISGAGVEAVSARAGARLDVEASAARVLEALAEDAAAVELVVEEVPPRIADPEPARSRAQALLAKPFTLVADDPLTDYQAEFAAPPERVATWLEAVPDGTQLTLTVDETSVREWLLDVRPQLGAERTLALTETLTRTMDALLDGEPRARASIRHPAKTYIVQPGDTLFDIAYEHGFPQWRLEEANPDVEPGSLVIGMELTIPSIDVLFPEPLVPNKRIEIDLPEQRLRAYEDDEIVFDFTCSSGMTSTPTIAGQFQVLFKERNAYAPRWSLDMPYFMGVYYEGPDFANGIHELPINASGQRLWSSVLGWPASYGCIILDVGDAERLYHWAPVGTLVEIEGVAPGTPASNEQVPADE